MLKCTTIACSPLDSLNSKICHSQNVRQRVMHKSAKFSIWIQFKWDKIDVDNEFNFANLTTLDNFFFKNG